MTEWFRTEEHLRVLKWLRDACESYRVGPWFVQKIPGGPGHKVRRVFPGLWRWWAWPHENAGRSDWFVAKGWASAGWRAHAAGREASLVGRPEG